MELPTLARIWNELADPSMPRVQGCGPTRRRQAQQRMRDGDETYWKEVIERINRSPFCKGSNPRGWTANFDFLIRPETQYKVREGQYDSKEGKKSVDPRYIAEKIWEAAGSPKLRERVKQYPPAVKALKETYGSWESLGQKRESDGPFVVNRLMQKLKELGIG